jgi:hypothetical protein
MPDTYFSFSNLNIYSIRIPYIEVPSINFEDLICCLNYMPIDWYGILYPGFIITIRVIVMRINIFGPPPSKP